MGYSCTSYKLILLSQHLPLDLKLPMGSGLPRVFLEYPASLLGDPWLMVAEKNWPVVLMPLSSSITFVGRVDHSVLVKVIPAVSESR